MAASLSPIVRFESWTLSDNKDSSDGAGNFNISLYYLNLKTLNNKINFRTPLRHYHRPRLTQFHSTNGTAQSVSTVTRLQTRWQKFWVRFPAEAKTFPSLQSAQTGSAAHTIPYPITTGKPAIRKVDPRFHQVYRLRMGGAIPPCPTRLNYVVLTYG